MNAEFNLISVIKTLLKWKWHITLLTLLAGIGSIITSVFIMKPYYQSFAIVYPVNQSMGDRGALFGSESVDAEDYYYGSKHDANRIITVATSSTLVQYIINKYDIVSHYDYKGKKYEASNTTEEFMENYQVYKTDKDAIRINLIDTDPNLAAEIVNDVVATIANETTRPIEANKRQLAELFDNQANQKKIALDSLLQVLMSVKPKDELYGLYKSQFDNAMEDFNEMSTLAEQYELASNQKMAGIEIIENAYPAERKLKPVRSKICLATTILGFILACLGALGIEQINDIKDELDK